MGGPGGLEVWGWGPGSGGVQGVVEVGIQGVMGWGVQGVMRMGWWGFAVQGGGDGGHRVVGVVGSGSIGV